MNILTPQKPDSVRFRGMMNSGAFVDERARILQTQVNAERAGVAITNREPISNRYLVEENSTPVAIGGETVLVETGLSPPPGMDSQYCLKESLNLFSAIRNGAQQIELENPLKSQTFAIVANIVAVIAFCACAWLAYENMNPDPLPTAAEATVEQAAAGVEGAVQHETATSIDELDEGVSTEASGAGGGPPAEGSAGR